MEGLEDCIFSMSIEQQKTHHLRQRNRIAKRVSRARQRQHQHQQKKAENVRCPTTQHQVPSSRTLATQPQSPRLDSPDYQVGGSVRMEDGPTPLYQAEPGPPFWDDTLSSPSNSTIDEDWSSFYPTLSPQHGCVPWTNQPTASISSAPLSWLDSNSHPIESSANLSGLALERQIPAHGTSNSPRGQSSRLLLIAVRNGTMGIVISLINAGADIDSFDGSGNSPLHLAVRFRRTKILEKLISHGANINARNLDNMTALEIAVRSQDEEIVNILLSSGADLN